MWVKSASFPACHKTLLSSGSINILESLTQSVCNTWMCSFLNVTAASWKLWFYYKLEEDRKWPCSGEMSSVWVFPHCFGILNVSSVSRRSCVCCTSLPTRCDVFENVDCCFSVQLKDKGPHTWFPDLTFFEEHSKRNCWSVVTFGIWTNNKSVHIVFVKHKFQHKLTQY